MEAEMREKEIEERAVIRDDDRRAKRRGVRDGKRVRDSERKGRCAS